MRTPFVPAARQVRVVTRRVLVGISVFHATSAVGGGVGMVVADGLGMPRSLLADSPFSTYLVPGIILAVVVGGTQTLASVLLQRRRPSAYVWSAVAGFGMVIWIVAEIGYLHVLGWAQMIYLVSGLAQLVLVFALLGIVAWLPRDPDEDAAQSSPGPVVRASRARAAARAGRRAPARSARG